MYKVKKLSFLNGITSLIFCTFLCFGILLFPKESINGALEALTACTSALIPSLFPFMLLSQFFVYSGVGAKLSPAFAWVTKKFFKLPPVAGITVFLSLVGGYPVGSRAIKALYEQNEITKSQAERMAYFCVGGGPAFITGTVGVLLMRSYTAGMIIFVSQLVSAVLIGVFLSFRVDKNDCKNTAVKKSTYQPFSQALTLACADASQGIIIMCALVILFGSVLSLLDALKITDAVSFILMHIGINESTAKAIPSVLLEVTNACRYTSKLGAPTELTAFAVGFGGMCVHFQIYSSYTQLDVNKFKFTLCRIAQGILTAFFTYILFIFFPSENQAAVIFGNNVEPLGTPSVFAAASLFIMCCIFAVSFRQKKLS